MRAGSNFVRVPHAILAGMFGRRPQPHIAPNYILTGSDATRLPQIRTENMWAVGNFGLGIAEDVYFHLMVKSSGGPNCSTGFQNPEQAHWNATWVFKRGIQLMSKPGIRLAPEAIISACVLQSTMAPPFSKPFHCSGLCGAAGAEPVRFEVERSPEELLAAYTALSSNPRDEDQQYAFSRLLFPNPKA